MRKFLINILLRFVGVWDGTARFFIGSAEQKVPALAVIVSRKYYIERSERFPLTNLKALKQVLQNQLPADHFAVYNIEAEANNQRVVRSFLFHNNLRQQFPLACIWLPESWLFANLLTNNSCALINTNSNAFFVAKTAKQISSLPVTQSVKNLDDFRHAIGHPFLDSAQVDSKPADALLGLGLTSVSLSQLKNGFIVPQNSLRKRNVKPWLISAATFLILYVGIVSTYLIVGQQQLKADSANAEFHQLLTQHDNLLVLSQDTEARRKHVLEKAKSADMWSLLARLQKKDKVEITGLQLAGTEVTLRGQADNATAALEWLRNQPEISNAFFDAPVRSSRRDQESFVIRLQLNQPPAAEKG